MYSPKLIRAEARVVEGENVHVVESSNDNHLSLPYSS